MILLSIEGNIGSGKSTLLTRLRQNHPEWNFIAEPVETWKKIHDGEKNIIERFYQDQDNYAFSFQIMAYITRLKDLMQAVNSPPPQGKTNVFICERSTDTDHYVFAKMLYQSGKIREMDWQIYQQYIQTFTDQYQVSGVIYVQTDPEKCLQRIHTRARSGEEVVPLEYLQDCHQYHQDWLTSSSWENKVFTIDSTPDKDDNYYWLEQEDKIVKFIYSLSDSNNITTNDYVSSNC